MKLYGTPKSHFTRKVRLLLDHLEQPYDLIDIGNVADQTAGQFGDNPLMSVPVFEDERASIIDSDHIAEYVVRKWDPQDRHEVLTCDPDALYMRALLNGAMDAEVRLILAERTGLATKDVAYFDKARKIISNVLDWCDENSEPLRMPNKTFLQFHFICLWDHLKLYNLMDKEWSRLSDIAQTISSSRLVRNSLPL